MKTREKANTEALNDDALDLVAGGLSEDNILAQILKEILHPTTKPGGPINAK